MANKRSSISAGLRADATDWKRGCKEAQAATLKLKQDVEATKIKGPRMDAPNHAGITNYTRAAAMGFAGATFAAKAFFDSATTVEGLQRGLLGVSDGTEKIKDQMNALAALSEKPGMDMATAGKASIALQDAGLSAKESRDYIEQWSNKVALASGGAEEFKGVMVAVAQILGKVRVEQEELNQIRERVPIAGVISGIDGLRDKPKMFLDAVLERLKALPRAAAGSKEAADNLRDAWTQFMGSDFGQKVSGGIASLSDFASGLMKGKGIKGSFDEVYNKAANSTVGRVPELTAEEAARRQNAKKKAAADKESDARQKVNQRLMEERTTLKESYDIDLARAHGNEKRLKELEDERDVAKEIADMKKDGLKVDEDTLKAVKSMVAESRKQKDEVEATKRAMDAAKKVADAGSDLEVAKLRHMGHNRRADKLEDRKRVNDLVKDGVPRKTAESLVDQERDLKEDEALGPGRRRIRLRKQTPNVEIPRESGGAVPGEKKKQGAKGSGDQQSDGGGSGNLSAQLGEMNKTLKSIDQKVTPTAADRQRPVNRTA